MSEYTRGPAARKSIIPRDITVTAKGWRWVGEQKLLAMARRLAMWQREILRKKYPPCPRCKSAEAVKRDNSRDAGNFMCLHCGRVFYERDGILDTPAGG